MFAYNLKESCECLGVGIKGGTKYQSDIEMHARTHTIMLHICNIYYACIEMKRRDGVAINEHIYILKADNNKTYIYLTLEGSHRIPLKHEIQMCPIVNPFFTNKLQEFLFKPQHLTAHIHKN